MFLLSLLPFPAYFLPKIDPKIPRMICRPIWMPAERAALLPMDNKILLASSMGVGGWRFCAVL
jgi:hypothetical protein